MVDLTEFTGDDALRASLLKKKTKAQEKVDSIQAKANERIIPLQNEIAKYDALLDVLAIHGGPVAAKIAEVIVEDAAVESGDPSVGA